MSKTLNLYNSLSRKKEAFEPLVEGAVGMYVCGPTVYSDVHLGNCRTFVNFDLIYRFLLHLGYKVRYVRNITDVGHLLDDGEDRILKGARVLQLEPMEVVQKYANGFQSMMRVFNTLPPSIEPRATGHLIEQIEMIESIIANGFAYVANGSVYFDTPAFIAAKGTYGDLSGRVVEDLISETRDNLKNQDEKKHPSDFALWMKAAPEHILKWNSPWSVGFPGWHLECSAMSTKYLGPEFDIHGGGNDLKFPHHENEIAQNVGACNHGGARYWLHTNMLLLNGKKMSKSDGNNITPDELFTGKSEHVTKGYSPMAIRFFMLQAHYRSTLDLTDEALQAAEKGYRRLMEANKTLSELSAPVFAKASELDAELLAMLAAVEAEMLDDFNAPKALARLFEIVPKINGLAEGQLSLKDVTSSTLATLKATFQTYLFDVFGLADEAAAGSAGGQNLVHGLMSLILEIRQEAREKKDWGTSDIIRDRLTALNITVKDGKDGVVKWKR